MKYIFNKSTLRILGIYLVGGYGVVEFVEFIVNHYMLSRNLIDVSIVTMLSMIPSVWIVAYYSGKNGWTWFGKIGIPVNFIATTVFLFILFHEKELGATTTTITVEDEEGKKIERVIPKSEFRKEAIIFFFNNETGDPKLNWLQYGIATMLALDLSQDLFLDITNPYDFSSKMVEAGFAKGVGLPLTLKRKLAHEQHYSHFMTGTYSIKDGAFFVRTSVYETRRTKLITENTHMGKDIFNLTDEISVQIKQDLGIPTRHIEDVSDLPVSEITTNSLKAFELAIIGVNKIEFDNDFGQGMKYLEEAVKEDMSFAYVYSWLLEIYLVSNMSEKRDQTLELLMKYLYKLPESKQYSVKATYHALKGNREKQLAILKMWSDLYPDDITPHERLRTYYSRKDQFDKMISEYKLILELDTKQYYCIRGIGNAYKHKGEFETALKYYEQYAELFPDDYRSFTIIGDLYKTMGDYSLAKSFYEKALTIEPEKISILVELADIESVSGNFENASEQYEDALKLCETSEDKESVYEGFSSFYVLRGQMSKSLEYLHLELEETEKIAPPIQILAVKLFYLDVYIKAGKKDDAFRILQTIESQIQPPYDKFISLGYCLIYIELGDTVNTDKAEKALDEFEQAYNKGEIPFSTIGGLLLYHGKINEMKGKYEDAVQNYKDEFKNDPADVTVNIAIGRCYRKLKQIDKAREYLENCLKILPFDPEAQFEIALIYYDMGDNEKALEHLKVALDIWKDADPVFEPAKKAKAKLEEWIN